MRQATSQVPPTSYTQAVDVTRRFVASNKWRLHSLFSRLKHASDDYSMAAEEVTAWLAMVGGIQPLTRGKSNWLVDLHAAEIQTAADARLLLGLIESHFSGSLDGVPVPYIQRYVCSCGMDSSGRVDFRTVVDDHAVMGSLLLSSDKEL